MLFVFLPIIIERNLNKITKVLTYRSRLGQGSRVKKRHLKKTARNQRENHFKGMLTQLYMRVVMSKNENNKNRSKHNKYVRD